MGAARDRQKETPLLTRLAELAQRSDAAFHTPGHRRGRGVTAECDRLLGTALRGDLPELPELDNLFAPVGVIHEAQSLAAEAFGAERTWFLANGSTSGIIAAIAATCSPGDRLALPRNVHQSAIAGLITTGAVPVFMAPDFDPTWGVAQGVAPATVAATLAQYPDLKAVLIVSPTYYGVCPDVAAIAELCHQAQVPLIVDEAHGAHFAFHPELPPTALAAGADLAVQSTHKTLPALTQAAMLHLQGDRISATRLAQALTLVQSTSPNYLLLASLDAARWQMATNGAALLEQALALADSVRSRLSSNPALRVLQPADLHTAGAKWLDHTRLTVDVSALGFDGFTLDEHLRTEFGVVAELPSLQHLTFILTHGNTTTEGDRLVAAFNALAAAAPAIDSSACPTVGGDLPSATLACSPREAFFAPIATCPWAEAIGHISAELLCPYPPGIPVLIPGEVISEAAIAYLRAILAQGGTVTGCTDPTLATLTVLQI